MGPTAAARRAAVNSGGAFDYAYKLADPGFNVCPSTHPYAYAPPYFNHCCKTANSKWQ